MRRRLCHQPVTCRLCGRHGLRGWKLPHATVWMVRYHAGPDGAPCSGHEVDIHRPDRKAAA